MSPLIPVWIIGGPVIGLLILAFSFKGPSAMGGSLPRTAPQRRDGTLDPSAPFLDPMHPSAPRRQV